MESQANYFTTQAQLESKSQTRISISAIQKHSEQHMCIQCIAWTPWLIKLDHWQINNRMTWLNQTASRIRSLHDPRIYKFRQACNVSLTFSRTAPIHYIIGNNKNSRATQSSIKNGGCGGSRAGSTPSPTPLSFLGPDWSHGPSAGLNYTAEWLCGETKGPGFHRP